MKRSLILVREDKQERRNRGESLHCLTTGYSSRYAVTLRLAFLLSNPTTPKDLAPLKAVDTSNERLTPKLWYQSGG
ncbi:hypothetical protein H6F93_23235 [Leptolyngbya sp. FACHB-671]|uniref:hypothetical protein n=1 Tax=Leptolyngbya sp. FACHB-671 TaxID=2692812 RepID=UPI001687E7E0|nr:hypothetical protein [Leptolyngbya sp. FACHB-671]MBD2070388.1 hypothetical protein [Leptolyngbya sp. FACHB-671]